MAVTMKEIARLAGVSRPVVSAVLNGSSTVKVSQENRRRILELIREHNFQPNGMARMLNGKTTRTIGVFVPAEMLPIQQELVRQLSLNFEAAGYRIFLVPANMPGLQASTIEELTQYGAAGIMLCHCNNRSFRHTDYRIPIVNINGSPEDSDITCDLEHGLYDAICHLLRHGHRKIAFFGIQPQLQREKLAGYRRALAEAGIPEDSSRIVNLLHHSGFGDDLRQLLADGFTAFAATNDLVATRLVTYLHQHGIEVPRQVAVTGFDGDYYAASTTCRIATVCQPVAEIARESVALLFDKMEKQQFARIAVPRRIAPVFFPSDSCGCPAPPLQKILWDRVVLTMDNENQ